MKLLLILSTLFIFSCKRRESKPDERDRNLGFTIQMDTAHFAGVSRVVNRLDTTFWEVEISTEKGFAAGKKNGKWIIRDTLGAIDMMWNCWQMNDSMRNAHPFVLIQTSPADTFRYTYPDTIYVGPDKNLQQL